MTVRVGALLWPQTNSWPVLRDAEIRDDRAGLDSLWTWDHLMAIVGPSEQPILEGWTTLAALASITERPTLGLMVGANTFRNPGLTAKLRPTVEAGLDHLIVDAMAPYDAETLERLPEVRKLLDG
ncbi:MAG TPA: hypothetical protein VHM48_06950 [Candidatus Limnocylindrales bacterium]|nr:hypothetical protein [Candidatus Limnocylindrales bacterium]